MLQIYRKACLQFAIGLIPWLCLFILLLEIFFEIFLLENVSVDAIVHRLTYVGLKRLTERRRESLISTDKLHWEGCT